MELKRIFIKVLREYNQLRITEKTTSGVGSKALLQLAESSLLDELSDSLPVDMELHVSRGSGELAKKPFMRISHEEVCSSGTEGVYVAVYFFTELGDQKLKISITRGLGAVRVKGHKGEGIRRSRLQKELIYKTYLAGALSFVDIFIPKNRRRNEFSYAGSGQSLNDVSIVWREFSIVSLKKMTTSELVSDIVYLLNIYRNYVDSCLIELGKNPLAGKRSENSKKALVKIRDNQAKFRSEMLEKYQRCVVTGCKIHEICDAAHIVPYSVYPNYNPNNGLLLRADIHRLFDAKLLFIGTDGVISLAPKVKPFYKILPQKLIVKISKEMALLLREREAVLA